MSYEEETSKVWFLLQHAEEDFDKFASVDRQILNRLFNLPTRLPSTVNYSANPKMEFLTSMTTIKTMILVLKVQDIPLNLCIDRQRDPFF